MEVWYHIVSLLPFEWAQPGTMLFMKNALLGILVLCPLLGLLSCHVVTGNMSFFSDALGHSAFTGIAIGSICGMAFPLGMAVLLSAVFALLFTYVRRRSNLSGDTADRRFFFYRSGTGHSHCNLGRRELYQVQ